MREGSSSLPRPSSRPPSLPEPRPEACGWVRDEMFVRSLVNSLPDATDRHGSDGSMTSDATLVESSPGEGAWQGLCRAPRRCASDGRLRSCSPPPRQPPTAATNPSEMPTRGTETLLTAMECADGPPSVLMARLLAYHASRADRGRQQQPRDEPRGPDADGKQRPDDTSLPPLRTLDLPKFLATVARARSEGPLEGRGNARFPARGALHPIHGALDCHCRGRRACEEGEEIAVALQRDEWRPPA